MRRASLEASHLQAGDPDRRFRVRGLRWWIALLLMGVTVVNYLDRSCLSVAAPVLKKDLSIDELHFSRIVMAFQLTYLMMQPISGRIIDWLDLRAGLALSILWWSAAQMLSAVAGGWGAFAAFRAVLGMGEAGNFPAASKAVSQWFRPRERTIATGVLNVGAGVGALIAPPIVVFLMSRYGWPAAFVATGAAGIVWVTVWLLFYRPPEEHRWLSKAELSYIREGATELLVDEPLPGESVWKAVLTQRNFWALALARFLSEPAWQFFTYWIPLYLVTERHLEQAGIARVAGVPFIAGDLGCILGGLFSPLFVWLGASVMTARKLAATACALLMVLAGFIGTAPSVGWAIAFFCVGAFAHQAMSSTLLTLPADLFPKRMVATANGLSGTVGGLGGLLFTMVVGIVVPKVGYGPLFVAIAFFDLVGSALLWGVLREQRREGALSSDALATPGSPGR
ncbi:MAG TPA: MFS transporter [Polyangiaceae bacterium]|nr:MFS transporter [Polyangiaceae bacterium]